MCYIWDDTTLVVVMILSKYIVFMTSMNWDTQHAYGINQSRCVTVWDKSHDHLFTSLQHVQTGSEQQCFKVTTRVSSISLRFWNDMVDLTSQTCPARGEQIKSISLRIQHTEHMTHMDSSVVRHCANGPSSRILPPFCLCVRNSLPD